MAMIMHDIYIIVGDEMHGGDGHCQCVNHHCRHHNHYLYDIKFIKLIVDNLSHWQFESLSPLIIFVKGNGNDVLVIICRSLSLGCW